MTNGINLNGSEASDDADVLAPLLGVEVASVDGSDRVDVIDASGGFGTGGDFELQTILAGMSASDMLHAGTGFTTHRRRG